MRSRNEYRNRPFPRPVSDGARRGWRPWSPNPNPGAVRTLTEADITARRDARYDRSTKHQVGAVRSVPPSSGEVRIGAKIPLGVDRPKQRGRRWWGLTAKTGGRR